MFIPKRKLSKQVNAARLPLRQMQTYGPWSKIRKDRTRITKMKKGESAKLHHSGALTITCSSGDQPLLRIKTKSRPN